MCTRASSWLWAFGPQLSTVHWLPIRAMTGASIPNGAVSSANSRPINNTIAASRAAITWPITIAVMSPCWMDQTEEALREAVNPRRYCIYIYHEFLEANQCIRSCLPNKAEGTLSTIAR